MSDKNVVIFEDDKAGNFNPLTLTRPAFELISGMKTLWENIVNRFYPDAEVSFVCRDYLKATFQQRVDAKVNDLKGFEEPLFVNGRVMAAFSELPPINGAKEIGVQDELLFSVDFGSEYRGGPLRLESKLSEYQSSLNSSIIPKELKEKFKSKNISLSDNASVLVKEADARWLITDGDKVYIVRKEVYKKKYIRREQEFEIDIHRLDIYQHDVVVYARLSAKDVEGLADNITDNPEDFYNKLASLDLPRKEVEGVELANYLCKLVLRNEDDPEKNAIEADFKFYADPKKSTGVIERGALVRVSDGDEIKVYEAEEAMNLVKAGKLPLYVGEGAHIYPNVLINLAGGPVYIGAYTEVRPPTLIDGPCCIMDSAGTPKKTTIIDGALIRPGAVLGPVCRVGGELEASIIQGYTNKHHAGFIGHAYLGEWVNIGAMATNSDLKNDMSDVKVPVNGQLIDTGELKVGSFIGDHVKLGIGALLTTGTSVGIMTNVLASGSIPPQDIPSFCFYREDRLSRGFRPTTLIEIADMVMARRRVEQTQADVELLEKVYEMIKDARDAEIEKHNRRVDNAVVKIIRQAERKED